MAKSLVANPSWLSPTFESQAARLLALQVKVVMDFQKSKDAAETNSSSSSG